MIGRFKSAFLSAVSNTGLDASVVGLGGSSDVPSSSSSGRTSRKSSSSVPFASEAIDSSSPPHQRIRKYEYSRPHFLQLVTSDEVAVSADHAVRPILVPRDLSFLPWQSGYAETINSGKSKLNEDQARVHFSFLRIPPPDAIDAAASAVQSADGDITSAEDISIPYFYFGVFDGHAGAGAAVAAASKLHLILHEKLMEIGHHLIEDEGGSFCEKGSSGRVLWFPSVAVTRDSLIVGALEAAFNTMDESIREDNLRYEGVNGGCTSTICLFILGKVYTANAGDSRAIYCMRNSEPVPLSTDFTPESERTRVRQLAAQKPELLGSDFTSNEYLRRPVKKDVGSKILYRAAHMTGWAYKTATLDDLKFPVVFGHGKRSRVLATIGVTRGFGDHELTAHSSNTRIKPFLSSQPEVKILDLTEPLDSDSVIVIGTDGLWDVTPNAVASRIVFSSLESFPAEDSSRAKYRYVSAAQDLVMHARGKFNERNWKMNDGSAATIDDISVFVIPIGPYRDECLRAAEKTTCDLNGTISMDTSEISLPDKDLGSQRHSLTVESGVVSVSLTNGREEEKALDALESVLNNAIMSNGAITDEIDLLDEPNH